MLLWSFISLHNVSLIREPSDYSHTKYHVCVILQQIFKIGKNNGNRFKLHFVSDDRFINKINSITCSSTTINSTVLYLHHKIFHQILSEGYNNVFSTSLINKDSLLVILTVCCQTVFIFIKNNHYYYRILLWIFSYPH